MDVVDVASTYEEIGRMAAIANAQSGRLTNVDGMSAEHCERCGAPIPEVRRAAIVGVRYCIECQEKMEQGNG